MLILKELEEKIIGYQENSVVEKVKIKEIFQKKFMMILKE